MLGQREATTPQVANQREKQKEKARTKTKGRTERKAKEDPRTKGRKPPESGRISHGEEYPWKRDRAPARGARAKEETEKVSGEVPGAKFRRSQEEGKTSSNGRSSKSGKSSSSRSKGSAAPDKKIESTKRVDVVDASRVSEFKERAATQSFVSPILDRSELASTHSVSLDFPAPASTEQDNSGMGRSAEVGGVPLTSVVDKGSLNYVMNFEQYLLDPQDQTYVRPPRVMVDEDAWEPLCSNLLRKGVFDRVHEDDLFKVDGKPLLNGLFGVSKQEFTAEGFEVMRIIMNLIPLNSNVRTLDSDISTLPTWSGISPLELMVDESLVISSEDVRCFFYIFKVPCAWFRYMAFNKPLPPSLCGTKLGKWYPCSAVLPMGFKNSVSLAQHIHRNLAQKALVRAGLGGECEMRKDRIFSSSNPVFRVYLDNFDELKRVSRKHAELFEGKLSPLVTELQQVYAETGVPRHSKKAVASKLQAEVQGAIVDGELGIICPKPEKLLKYLHLTKLLLQDGACTQKQAQVVGGGLVYFALFRRPLLGGLNHLWKFINSFEGYPPVVRLPLPAEVIEELSRVMALAPLSVIDMRCKLSKVVTASDASCSGGGVTVSQALTPQGAIAAQCPIRGDLVEPVDLPQVLTIGIFDSISGLRVAADILGWNVSGHISIEKSAEASRVVESKFPNTTFVSNVEDVTEEMVKSWSLQHSQVGLVAIGAGPPCQGVSGLNAAKKGALKDARSSLFRHVRRIKEMVQQHFPWAQVRNLMESVASMDQKDETVMSTDYGDRPYYIDSSDVSPARRPRLYWVDWELLASDDLSFEILESGRTKVCLKSSFKVQDYLLPGWEKRAEGSFPTFTTSRPRSTPGYKPAGLHQCEPDDLEMWRKDLYRFPPYQYQKAHSVFDRHGSRRLLNCDDLMLQASSEDLVRYHRIRASARYKDALDNLKDHNLVLPPRYAQLDGILSDYLEHLWAEGLGRTVASNVLAAIQDSQPQAKGHLSESWRLLRTWSIHEVPNRAPPLPLEVVHALCGYGLFKEQPHMTLSILVAFYGLLQTGEVLSLQAKHVTVNGPKGPAVISLGLTKGGKRQGAAESVTIYAEDVCRRLHQWVNTTPSHSFLAGPSHVWRRTFSQYLSALGFSAWDFRPYSLRRGGATDVFKKQPQLDKLLILGRWQSARTARLYLNEGMAAIQHVCMAGAHGGDKTRRVSEVANTKVPTVDSKALTAEIDSVVTELRNLIAGVDTEHLGTGVVRKDDDEEEGQSLHAKLLRYRWVRKIEAQHGAAKPAREEPAELQAT
eukprot:Skav233719  [mRNA]  locus=scaffold2120:365768:377109:+ [translate_table: standard]